MCRERRGTAVSWTAKRLLRWIIFNTRELKEVGGVRLVCEMIETLKGREFGVSTGRRIGGFV